MASYSIQAVLEGIAVLGSNNLTTLSRVPLSKTLGKQVPQGSNSDEANHVTAANNALGVAATTTVDLKAFADDAFEAAHGSVSLDLIQVYAFAIKAASTNQSTITIAAGATNPANDVLGAGSSVKLSAGEFFLITCDQTTSAGAKEIDITNDDGANGANYEIFMVARYT